MSVANDRDIQKKQDELMTNLGENIPLILIDCGLKLVGDRAYDTLASGHIVIEIATFAAKDIVRLTRYQGEELDPLKETAYVAYWIRKLKPFPFVAFEDENAGFLNINEVFAMKYLVRMAQASIIKSKDNRYNDPQLKARMIKAIERRFKILNKHNFLIKSCRYKNHGPDNFYMLALSLTSFYNEDTIVA